MRRWCSGTRIEPIRSGAVEEAALLRNDTACFPWRSLRIAFQLLPEANFIRLQDHAPDARRRFSQSPDHELRACHAAAGAGQREGGEAKQSSPPKCALPLPRKARRREDRGALRDYIRAISRSTRFRCDRHRRRFRFREQINDGSIRRRSRSCYRCVCVARLVPARDHPREAPRAGRWSSIHAIEEVRPPFPYIGNVPTIRGAGSAAAHRSGHRAGALREVLRSEYFAAQTSKT